MQRIAQKPLLLLTEERSKFKFWRIEDKRKTLECIIKVYKCHLTPRTLKINDKKKSSRTLEIQYVQVLIHIIW